MMVSKLCSTLLIAMISLSVSADVVVPGHINKQFMITNLDKFPGFKFAIKHYSFHYDKGWHSNPADTVMVENNKRYFTSEKGGQKESLMASDSKGRYSFSDLKVGGNAVVNPSVEGLVEVYTIISIKNKKIKLKKVKEILVYPDGKEKERKGGFGLAGFVGSDGFSSGLMIASTGALLALLVLFMLRKRKPKYIQMAT